MNIPEFTAEASLYKSNMSYRAFPSQGTFSTLAIMPQVAPPIIKGCYTCRSNCYTRAAYRNNLILEDCLDSCPC